MTENLGSEGNSQNLVAPPEKVLTPDAVNELVRVKKQEGFTKGYEQAKQEMQSIAPAAPVNSPVQNAGMPNDEAVRNTVADEIAKHTKLMQEQQLQKQQQEFAAKTLNEVQQKVDAAKSEYPDFDDVTKRINIVQDAPHVLYYANQFPNGGHILYDLAKNPSKMAAVASAPPSIAMAMLNDLSASINANKSAQNAQLPPEPLSQSKPSAIGVDNGSRGIRDYKKIFKG